MVRLIRAYLRRVVPPKGIPLWIQLAASAFAFCVVAVSLLSASSWLPLWAQLVLGAFTLIPWIPGVPQPFVNAQFVLLSLLPTFLLTWTGASPLLFGLVAMSAARVAISTTVPRTALYGLAGVGIVIGRHFVAHYDTHWWMWKTYIELGAMIGIALQRQSLLVQRTREASVEHAQVAALEERRRIARDVHDVLAHTLTILMVHLNSARLAVVEDPEGTAELLDEVASYGREALDEIRRTVGLLSEKPMPYAGGPMETAKAIEEMVQAYRSAGVDIDLKLDVELAHIGLLAQAPTAMWDTGYRIVQESLANAAKHAPQTQISLGIGLDDSGLRMTCANALRSDEGVVRLELPKGGNGVGGMRERVEGVGGTFSAGVEGTSWVVRAEVPLAVIVADAQALRPATLGRAS
jgi:signal transduction histidine kinase